MKRAFFTFLVLAALAASAFAGTFRVTYTTPRGQIHRVTVQAESTDDARRTVQYMFPGAVVTGAHRIGK
jgi:hypothetical protein